METAVSQRRQLFYAAVVIPIAEVQVQGLADDFGFCFPLLVGSPPEPLFKLLIGSKSDMDITPLVMYYISIVAAKGLCQFIPTLNDRRYSTAGIISFPYTSR